MKNIRVFLSENFQFLEVKFSIYLNRRVFVMSTVATKPLLPNFLGRAIVIINFLRRFLNFIADTVRW